MVGRWEAASRAGQEAPARPQGGQGREPGSSMCFGDFFLFVFQGDESQGDFPLKEKPLKNTLCPGSHVSPVACPGEVEGQGQDEVDGGQVPL